MNAKLALQWPLAEQMAKACRALGFEAVFEVCPLFISRKRLLWTHFATRSP